MCDWADLGFASRDRFPFIGRKLKCLQTVPAMANRETVSLNVQREKLINKSIDIPLGWIDRQIVLPLPAQQQKPFKAVGQANQLSTC